MIEITYKGSATAADIPSVSAAVTDEIRRLANWPDGAPIETRQAGDGRWIVICGEEIATAVSV